MEYKALTGLTFGQLNTLAPLVSGEIGSAVKPAAAKPPVIGLFHSVVMVVTLMRRNLIQAAAGEIFGCSQATVSRRWDLLRPVIAKAFARFIPDPVMVLSREGTALVDGTVCPTWGWHAIPNLFSAKARYAGMNIQVAANLDGEIAAIGPEPVHGARHDAHAYEASGLKALLENVRNTAADLGYIGVDGIDIVPFKRAGGRDLREWQGEFNAQLSRIRSAVEHAVAKVKAWRMLSEEGGRFRCPIGKYESMLAAVTGLLFFVKYSNG